MVGKFADHRLKSGLEREDRRGAAARRRRHHRRRSHDEDRLAIEQALPGTPAKSVVQTDEGGLLRPLKDSLAEAMGKFEPDRTELPIPDRTFGGTCRPHAARLRRRTGR